MEKKWFSFVEVIIVVTILILLAVVWVSFNNQYKEWSQNTKITADLWSVKNALTLYREEQSVYPVPWGNLWYFDQNSQYKESENNAFWVYGKLTENTLSKSYINYIPIDPRTHQYYWYGKTIDNSGFEVAWVFVDNFVFFSWVVWNYSWEQWPLNLIREYNWPDFVYDRSTQNFPYNPQERSLTAQITSYSWTLQINNNVVNEDQIYSYTFRTWDDLKVSAWGFANVYFSDWSSSTIWDSTYDSEITFATMEFVSDNNLITKIQLALNIGAIWTQAPDLDENSSFEVFTTDTTAAVRWTIFWVLKTNILTNVTVTEWIVKIWKLLNLTSFWELVEKIKSKITLVQEIIDIAGTTYLWYEWDSQQSYIQADWSTSVWVDISSTRVESATIENTLEEEVSNNVKIKILSITKDVNSWVSITFEVPEVLRQAEKVVIRNFDQQLFPSVLNVDELLSDNGTITLDSTVIFETPAWWSLANIGNLGFNNFFIALCKNQSCSYPVEIFLIDNLDVGQNEEVWATQQEYESCPFSFTFPNSGKCIANPFARNGYELVWITDFTHKELGGKIIWKWWEILLHPENDITDNYVVSSNVVEWVRVKSGRNISYMFDSLRLWNDYIIELKIWGGAFETSGTQTLFKTDGITPYNSLIYFKSSSQRKIQTWNWYHFMEPTLVLDKESVYDVALNIKNWLDTVSGITSQWSYTIYLRSNNIDGNIVTFDANSIALRDFNHIYIGWESSSSTAFTWIIKWLKVYKKVPPPTSWWTKEYIPTSWGINSPPQVNAGENVVLAPGTTQTLLNGSFYDPNGWNHQILWEKISWPTGGTPTPVNTLESTISNLVSWIYEYRLSVIDDGGLSGSNTVSINIWVNQEPIAVVTGSVLSSNVLQLNSIGSYDPENGTNISFHWEKINWPTWGNVLSPTNPESYVSTFSQSWVYEYKLTVVDQLWTQNVNTTNKIRVDVTQPTPTSISWFWCAQCPNGSWMSGRNLDWEHCWPFWWEKSEYYCTGVKYPSNGWQDVICSREKTKPMSMTKCQWWENRSWSWNFYPPMTSSLSFPN